MKGVRWSRKTSMAGIERKGWVERKGWAEGDAGKSP